MCTWRELVATGSRTLPHAFSMGKKGKGAARPKTPPPPQSPGVFNTTHRSPYCANEGLKPTYTRLSLCSPRTTLYLLAKIVN